MTGYGDRFIGSFNDSNGNRINIKIQKKDYSSLADTLVFAANPLVISKPEGDLFTHIYGTGCKINIINTGSLLQYTELFGTPEREFYVYIEKVGDVKTTVLFEGFILPQMFEQSLRLKSSITIPANDQLSTLKYKQPELLEEDENYVNLMDLIKEIVWSTDILNPIYVKNGLYNTYYSASWDPSINAIEQTYVDKNLFLEDGEPKDSYTVLESILKTFGSRLYYNNKGWYIDRVKDHANTTYYKKYFYDTSVSTVNVSQPKIDLDNQYIIEDSGTIQYEAGVKNYELTLNTELFDNLVSNNFTKLSRATEIDYLGGSILPEPYVHYSGYFYPSKYEWLDNCGAGTLDNGFETDGTVTYWNKNYKDQNILNSGIDWNAVDGTRYEVKKKYAAIGTKITIDYFESPSFKVEYKNSFVGQTINTGRAYRTRYGIRYENSSGDQKFIVLDSNGDPSIKSTAGGVFYNSIKNEVTGQEIIDNNYCINVNDTINIGDILPEIKTDMGYITGNMPIIELYFDFLLSQENISDTWYELRTKVGDLNISSAVNIEPNVIEATIAEGYNTKLSFDLDVFDSSSVSIKNTLLFADGSAYIPTGGNPWSEYNFAYDKSLQQIYLTDIIQNYSQNRYKFSADVKMNSNSVPNLNNTYSYSFLTKDSSEVDLLCVGYDYNVKENTYRFSLNEWVADNGYYIYVPEVSAYITLDPTDASFSTDGSYGYIDVYSNTLWDASTLSDWITIIDGSGYLNGTISYSVSTMELPGSRFGDIDVSGGGVTASATITQYYE